jgi:hypothetical protein
MFNWFNNWFAKKCQQAWEQARNQPEENMVKLATSPGLSRGRRLDRSNGMNFTIHQANGGFVMEYSSYDPRTDRSDSVLHIINADQDLGQGIAHIITFEMLRK